MQGRIDKKNIQEIGWGVGRKGYGHLSWITSREKERERERKKRKKL